MYLKRVFWLILLVLIKSSAFAQDTIMVISPALYEGVEEIYPAKLHGWYFKQGSDTDWAAKVLDLKGWKKMRPVDLSVDLADANGKVEGWFRGIIKIDSSFGETQLSLLLGKWAAQDIYIDGKKFASAGNTGSNGLPYKENTSINFDNITSLSALKPGSIHTIALHILDSRAFTFSGKKLKGEIDGLQKLIEINSQRTIKFFAELRQIAGQIIFGIILGLLILIALLWLLWILNKEEENIFHFALFTTFLDLYLIIGNIWGNQFYSSSTSYTTFYWLRLCSDLFLFLAIAYIPYLLAVIFRHPLKKWIIWLTLIPFFLNLSNYIFLANQIIEIVSLIGCVLISIYIILSSLKKAKGSDWSIIVGIFLTLVSWLCNDLFITDFKMAMFFAIGGLFFFPLSFIVYIAIRFREMIRDIRANAEEVIKLSDEKRIQAEQQKELLEQEVLKQTVELRNSLEHLKATQGQLIQSEKMASLGELTAGIAHEIQNPLNFVNNFSDVNRELLVEMKDELTKGNLDDVKQIADDVISNEEKINHHGKRADAIVKGMLQHSRSSSGQKEATDINALCDEYLRLAYHGLRAKDKSFNASLETQFDDTIGKINIQPQEMGRVILNLINNAFYAVSERKKNSAHGYEPKVTVSTEKKDNNILISVKDNGTGIPQKVVDKIFQPFFTTKPTGQGTGLGLSLSYDIVKAHGGELTLETKEGEGTTFQIRLTV